MKCMYLVLVIALFACETSEEKKLGGKELELFKEIKLKYKESDTPQLNAARFLIGNLAYQFSQKGQRIDKFIDLIDKADSPLEMSDEIEDFNNIAEQFELNHIRDLDSIDTDYIKSNIDQAFEVYNKASWSSSVTFDMFCQYILPYKVGYEKQGEWRDYYLSKYLPLVDSSIFQKDMKEAARLLHAQMWDNKRNFKLISSYIPELPLSITDDLQAGSCHELSYYGISLMRAFGIPTALDFTAQYGNRSGGHEWCAIVFSPDSCLGFDASVDSLGFNQYSDPNTRFAKVWRWTFQPNKGGHNDLQPYNKYLPNYFNDPRIIDVTSQYANTKDIDIDILDEELGPQKIGYLSAFDNKNWIPVAWGTTVNDKVIYKDVAEDVVYLPQFIEEEKRQSYNYPFILHEGGSIQYLKPEKDSLRTINIKRKYPLTTYMRTYLSRISGGRFQGSNSADFKNAVDLHEIKDNSWWLYSEVDIKNEMKFKYVRYLSGPNGYCNMAEIEFYGAVENKKPLKGKIIGTDKVYEDNPAVKKYTVFDGDPLTYFDAADSDGAWVGLGLKEPTAISKIRFMPRNDMNGIVENNQYELFYWDGEWVSLGSRKGGKNKGFLSYENAPMNALFLLRNFTEGKEERIFTYRGDEQIWW